MSNRGRKQYRNHVFFLRGDTWGYRVDGEPVYQSDDLGSMQDYVDSLIQAVQGIHVNRLSVVHFCDSNMSPTYGTVMDYKGVNYYDGREYVTIKRSDISDSNYRVYRPR